MKKLLIAAAITSLGCASANAATATIDGITVSDSGLVDPATAPDYAQPNSIATVGLSQQQFGSPGTLPGNPGWDPYGPSDGSHHWWNLYSGNVTFNLTGSSLNIVWGSPNYDDPANANYVSFYSGAGGDGALLGTVLASDLYANFGGIDNNNHPGYLISFGVPGGFGSAVFGNTTSGASDFEFAIVGVPETSSWAMMLAGFAGLGFLGARRSRRAVALSL